MTINVKMHLRKGKSLNAFITELIEKKLSPRINFLGLFLYSFKYVKNISLVQLG